MTTPVRHGVEMTWHEDGTRTVQYAPDHLSVGATAWGQIQDNPTAWDGQTLTLDTAGEYQYRMVGGDELILRFERIGS